MSEDRLDKFKLFSESPTIKKQFRLEQEKIREQYKLSRLSVWSTMPYFISSSLVEIKRRLCLYLLAFFSIYLVVLTTCVTQTLISSLPIIFKTTSESAVGQIDAIVTPKSSLFNMTQINKVLSNNDPDLLSQMIGRVNIDVQMTTDKFCKIKLGNNVENRIEMSKIYQSILNTTCQLVRSGQMRVIDTQREKQMKIGGKWPFPKIPNGKIMVHQQLMQIFQLKKGDYIYLKFEITNIEQAMKSNYELTKKTSIVNDQTHLLVVPYQIESSFTNNEIGLKFPEGSETVNSFIVEMDTFIQHITDYFFGISNTQMNIDSGLLDHIRKQKVQEYLPMLIFNYRNRNQVYEMSNYDEIQKILLSFGTQISNGLGLFVTNLSLPILQLLFASKFVSLFFGLTVNMIIFILLILSIVLIYSLLLVSVETKSFQVAIIRILGLNKTGIIVMIIIQCLTYVIPAILIGVLTSIPILIQIGSYVSSLIDADIKQYPSDQAILYSILIGIIIPFFSSIVPIRIALQQELATALDSTRNQTQAVKIVIKDTQKLVSVNRIYFSLVTAFFGISIYYLLPLSLLSFDIGLLLAIFLWILIGMLLGSVLLTINVQYLVEKLVVRVFFICAQQSTQNIIIKNLAAHRIRNRRTGLMYSISLAFVIYLQVSYILTTKFNVNSFKQKQGTYLGIKTQNKADYISLSKYADFIKSNLTNEVVDFAYVTPELYDYYTNMKTYQSFNIKLTHLGRLFQFNPKLYGVSANYQDIVFSEFNKYDDEQKQDSGLSLTQQLYTVRGSQSGMVSFKYYQDLLLNSQSKDSAFFIKIDKGYKNLTTKQDWYQFRPLASITSFSGFRFSKRPTQTSQPVLFSIPTFMNLLGNENINSLDQLKVEKILFRLKDYSSDTIYQLKQKMNKYSIQQSDQIDFYDLNNYSESLNQQAVIINTLFSVITVIVMILCYFSLISAMTANIYEQTKEIAIYRALGVTINLMQSVYRYEAFVLVFSSSLMGMFIGSLLGFIMTMQRGLFTDLPLNFEFPISTFITVLILSIIVSYLSTKMATRKVVNQEISQISRMVL